MNLFLSLDFVRNTGSSERASCPWDGNCTFGPPGL